MSAAIFSLPPCQGRREAHHHGREIRRLWTQSARTTGRPGRSAQRDLRCRSRYLSPNALGAILNPDTLPRLRVKVVAGAANNQLATPNGRLTACASRACSTP